MLAATLTACALLSQGPIDPALANRYFSEAKWAAQDDGGKLWGKELYGPMIFVDRGTRQVVGNKSVEGIATKAAEGVFVGQLPPELTIANTAFDWKGKKISMVMWPPPDSTAERKRLLIHELFHRMQDEIGLPSQSVDNSHLDSMTGRIWLQMEIRALRKLMMTEPKDMKPVLEDALVFRRYRQTLFPKAKDNEDRMEAHEGMAEYTGMMLRGNWEPETRYCLGYRMQWFGNKRSFVASFAYETGPAYGLMLNMRAEEWRKTFKPSLSLAEWAGEAWKAEVPSDLKAEAEKRGQSYDLTALVQSETTRELQRLSTEKEYRRLLVDGPVLELPNANMKYSYNPSTVFPLSGQGTVYPVLDVVADWGTLTSKGPVLMMSDFMAIMIPAPAKTGDLKGEGWEMTLKPGWKMVAGKRKGDFLVVKG